MRFESVEPVADSLTTRRIAVDRTSSPCNTTEKRQSVRRSEQDGRRARGIEEMHLLYEVVRCNIRLSISFLLRRRSFQALAHRARDLRRTQVAATQIHSRPFRYAV